MTPTTGTSSWLTPAVFLTFVDFRPVAQLLKDDNVPSDYVSLTTSGTPDNAKLLTILGAACGRMEASLLRGKRYQVADLTALPAGSNAANYRDEITAKVAQQLMFRRRPADLKNYEIISREVDATLQALAGGEAIFPFLESQDAGLVQSVPETAQDVEARQLTSVIAARLFGRRGNQVYRGSGGWSSGSGW